MTASGHEQVRVLPASIAGEIDTQQGTARTPGVPGTVPPPGAAPVSAAVETSYSPVAPTLKAPSVASAAPANFVIDAGTALPLGVTASSVGEPPGAARVETATSEAASETSGVVPVAPEVTAPRAQDRRDTIHTRAVVAPDLHAASADRPVGTARVLVDGAPAAEVETHHAADPDNAKLIADAFTAFANADAAAAPAHQTIAVPPAAENQADVNTEPPAREPFVTPGAPIAEPTTIRAQDDAVAPVEQAVTTLAAPATDTTATSGENPGVDVFTKQPADSLTDAARTVPAYQGTAAQGSATGASDAIDSAADTPREAATQKTLDEAVPPKQEIFAAGDINPASSETDGQSVLNQTHVDATAKAPETAAGGVATPPPPPKDITGVPNEDDFERGNRLMELIQNATAQVLLAQLSRRTGVDSTLIAPVLRMVQQHPDASDPYVYPNQFYQSDQSIPFVLATINGLNRNPSLDFNNFHDTEILLQRLRNEENASEIDGVIAILEKHSKTAYARSILKEFLAFDPLHFQVAKRILHEELRKDGTEGETDDANYAAFLATPEAQIFLIEILEAYESKFGIESIDSMVTRLESGAEPIGFFLHDTDGDAYHARRREALTIALHDVIDIESELTPDEGNASQDNAEHATGIPDAAHTPKTAPGGEAPPPPRNGIGESLFEEGDHFAETAREIRSLIAVLYGDVIEPDGTVNGLSATPRGARDYQNIFNLAQFPITAETKVLDLGAGKANVSAEEIGLSPEHFTRADLAPQFPGVEQANALDLKDYGDNAFDETWAGYVLRQIENQLPEKMREKLLGAIRTYTGGVDHDTNTLFNNFKKFLGLQALSEMLRVTSHRVRLASFQDDFNNSTALSSLLHGIGDEILARTSHVPQIDTLMSTSVDTYYFLEKRAGFDQHALTAYIHEQYRRLIPQGVVEALLQTAAPDARGKEPTSSAGEKEGEGTGTKGSEDDEAERKRATLATMQEITTKLTALREQGSIGPGTATPMAVAYAQEVREAIASGKITPGTVLKGIQIAQLSPGVSDNDVQKGHKMLVDEELLQPTRQGSVVRGEGVSFEDSNFHPRQPELLNTVKEYILDSQNIPPGGRVPRRKILMEKFHVSKGRIDAALRDLIDAGELERQGGDCFRPSTTKDPDERILERMIQQPTDRGRVLRAIIREHNTPQSRLPSMNDLAEQLGVDRKTVEIIYGYLKAKGYTTAKRGRYVGMTTLVKSLPQPITVPEDEIEEQQQRRS